MNLTTLRSFCLAGGFTVLAGFGHAQIVQFNATINSAQETPASTSGATGSAVMLYNVATNTFDLVVTINDLANTITASHIHEAAPGVAGPVVTNLGSETVYQRTGNTVTASFRGLTHGGDKVRLLQNGAYVNFHSSQFPGGEVRGQLIAVPKKLVAVIDNAQERAAFPTTTFNATAQSYGGAVMSYNPGTNTIRLRLSLFNFTNTLSNSHFHAGAPAVSGAVVVNLGNNANTTFANGGSYTTANGFIHGVFDIPMTGVDPVGLLTGQTYLNFHSTAFTGGETRGQVRVSEEVPGSRLINISTRGFVGTGNQVLIQGVSVNGPDPVRLLISAKGPSLAAFGVTGALADPFLQLFDSAGRVIATNNDIGTVAATSELAAIPGAPTNSVESALVVVLPPGNYTAVVSGNGTATGIALLEALDLRTLNGNLTTSGVIAASPTPAPRRAVATSAIELCVGVPLAVTTVKR
ncbi:MAG: CHRD domain-containing protein [Verrucomicrobia bacterium]|nr:CHRD domain-containing protein [Verrucomicrobiota bacterium]